MKFLIVLILCGLTIVSRSFAGHESGGTTEDFSPVYSAEVNIDTIRLYNNPEEQKQLCSEGKSLEAQFALQLAEKRLKNACERLGRKEIIKKGEVKYVVEKRLTPIAPTIESSNYDDSIETGKANQFTVTYVCIATSNLQCWK